MIIYEAWISNSLNYLHRAKKSVEIDKARPLAGVLRTSSEAGHLRTRGSRGICREGW